MIPEESGVYVTAVCSRGVKATEGETGLTHYEPIGELPSLEQVVDLDIRRFEQFFRSLGNDGLSRPEYSIIKTYLHWKTHPEDPRGKETSR